MFTVLPRPSAQVFESLIPHCLRVDAAAPQLSVSSATLYIALHPLFTTHDNSSGGIPLDTSAALFHVISRSASTIIDHFAQLNEDNTIISIWMAADRVLEAGIVWAIYSMSQRGVALVGDHSLLAMGAGLVMRPTMKVSTLLMSFAARCKSVSAYVDAWDTLVELLWNML